MAEIRPHLVVGLGNPGLAYASTRHNIGFMVVDRLVRIFRLAACDDRVDAALTGGEIADVPSLALKPMTYMNRSGGPVGDIIRIYGIQCEDLVVIHDDIDLEYERLKIKEKGGGWRTQWTAVPDRRPGDRRFREGANGRRAA
jgi:PTH1 family peptidyl-tRNA hydrolase